MAGPQSLPECETAAPTAKARATGRRGQPDTPKRGPMPAGSQGGPTPSRDRSTDEPGEAPL
eukprot:6088554-Alexandrium_andersonii.AAC.1